MTGSQLTSTVIGVVTKEPDNVRNGIIGYYFHRIYWVFLTCDGCEGRDFTIFYLLLSLKKKQAWFHLSIYLFD